MNEMQKLPEGREDKREKKGKGDGWTDKRSREGS